MIVGNGLLAEAFRRNCIDHAKLTIFASGVSNSREVDPNAFEREKNLILSKFDSKKTFIYFSTCSIEDTVVQNTPYVRHKLEMESLVRTQARYWIFRLPQVVGLTPNPHTLTNFLFRRIISGQSFDVFKDATRNIIDVDDVARIVTYLVRSDVFGGGQTLNIATPKNISVESLVKIFEGVLGIAAKYNLISGGGSYFFDTTIASEIAKELDIPFHQTNEYARQVLSKYYSGKV